jgi:hypothetical protein
MKFIRKLAGIVLYPWILALYPVIYLYAVNFENIRQNDVVEVLFATVVITTVVYAPLYLLIRDVYKTGAVTAVIAFIFLTYGHIYDALNNKQGQMLLLPIMLVLGLMLAVAIMKSKDFWQRLTSSLNIICSLLFAIPFWQVVMSLDEEPPDGATTLANPLERVLTVTAIENSPEYPDVYYIIMDGYSSNELWLREYGYDNSAFTDALEERGFYIAYNSKANYAGTLLSLPSSLNMRYLTGQDKELATQNGISDTVYLRSLIANSRVADEFKQYGYSYIYFLSGYIAPSTLADTNIVFYPDGPRYFSGSEFLLDESNGFGAYRQPFWPLFLQTTLLRSVAGQIDMGKDNLPYPIFDPGIALGTFAELEKITQIEQATFTFAHITEPHLPIRFERDGSILDKAIHRYDPECATCLFDELHYINTLLLQLLDKILDESDVPPIIVIQGDHGTGIKGASLGKTLWNDFEILSAFYLPDNGAENLYDTITPVNSFRTIFNHYFDEDYELLLEEQFSVSWQHSSIFRWWDGEYTTHARHTGDDLLNLGLGDNEALIYLSSRDGHTPELCVHAVNGDGEAGDFLFVIAYEDIESYLNDPPPEDILVISNEHVAFYALAIGGFQFKITDDKGQEWIVTIDNISTWVNYGSEIGVGR